MSGEERRGEESRCGGTKVVDACGGRFRDNKELLVSVETLD